MNEAILTTLTTHPHAHLIYTDRFSASLIECLRFNLGDLSPHSASRWRSPTFRKILSNSLPRITKVFARAAKKLWVQRSATGLQVHAALAVLPPESTVNVPRILMKKAADTQAQQLVDAEENLTPEELGVIPPKVPPIPDPMATATPVESSPAEIQEIVSLLTFVPRPRRPPPTP